MPYRKEQFVNGEIYHIVLRAVDGNRIFKDINDCYRGIFSIYEFNNSRPVTIWRRRRDRIKKKQEKITRESVRGPSSHTLDYFVDERDKLVEVLAFCLMPNHIHLLVRQLNDSGIVKFMSKFGTGLGGYFNRKYERKGHVFQGRFVSVHIKDEDQLKMTFIYIHTNPISLIEPKWKEIGIKYPDKVINFLEERYRWSSYFDYIKKDNFPSVTEREFLIDIMNGIEGIKEEMENWIRYKEKIKELDLNEVTLE